MTVPWTNTGMKFVNQEWKDEEGWREGSSREAVEGWRNGREKDSKKLVGRIGQREGRRENRGNACESARQ